MKSLLRLTVLLLGVLLFHSGTFLQANEVSAIRGTFYTEQEFQPGRFRNITRPLTFRSICAAFGVSARDYRLYSAPGETNLLTLKPRFPTFTNLPSFVLLQTTGDARYLRNWSDRPAGLGIEHALTNPASSAFLFNDFRGTALGRVTAPARPTGGSAGFKYEVSGSSTNAILKFRFTVRPCIFPSGCP